MTASGSYQFQHLPWRGPNPVLVVLDELADWPVLCTCGHFPCDPEHHVERAGERITEALKDAD